MLNPLLSEDIFDPTLFGLANLALTRIHSQLFSRAPAVAGEILGWLSIQSTTGLPADAFRDLRAHILLFPWFLESVQAVPDLKFHGDVVYASVNAYYYVRLLDNVMDRHEPGQFHLLPLLGFFHSNFQSAWQTHFPHTHPFWEYFHSVWSGMAEATTLGAQRRNYSERDFVEISVKKICGIKIPMAAVSLRHNRADILDTWFQIFDAFSCFNEILDGLFDWQQDLMLGDSTYLISEAARRKRGSESSSAWIVRKGAAWAYSKARKWIRRARNLAQDVDSPGLQSFLKFREVHAALLWRNLTPDLNRLKDLAAALEGCRPSPASRESERSHLMYGFPHKP